MKKYRLALDIGTNSIGWCALNLNEKDAPAGILDLGVRIFPDGRNPKDGSSNAVARREARAMRRNRDRFVERRNKLLDLLVTHGLLPSDADERRALTALDPYKLRRRGLDEALTPHEFGRALFHLNQRRGFKSNRKSDASDSEAGAIKGTLREQSKRIAESGARTFGEFMCIRKESGESVRSRLKTREIKIEGKDRTKKENYYDLYPARVDLEKEFLLLWETQATHLGNVLTDTARKAIRECIFYQRPLKPTVVGKCTFEPAENRAPKALPVVHHLRVLQELNNLHILDKRTLKGHPLTLEERNSLLSVFLQPNGRKGGKCEVTFDKIRKRLALTDSCTFSHESEKRKGLEADTTSALLAHKERFGQRWYGLSEEEQTKVVTALLEEHDEEALIQSLMDEHGLDRQHAEGVSCTPLPDGYARLGLTATRKILAALKTDVIPYSDAVLWAGYGSHSQFNTGQRHDRLPYYGVVLERHVIPNPENEGHPAAPLEKRFGKVTNPTVHIALNQLRKVVNEIIKLHGPPAEIHVEVLRDLKNSLKAKKEIQAAQAKNQQMNDDCARRLREVFHESVNRANILRLRLWDELGPGDRLCVYTGETISADMLFTEQVEIDHILPFQRTLDDSMANKILCVRRANREKTDRTPHEAWANQAHWEDILARSAALPKNKRRRFAEDAMEQYLKENDFIARQLTDSQYITRLARAYLAVLFDPEEAHKVVCLPGRLTGLFRKHLGLSRLLDEINPERAESTKPIGEKNRNDHRNHTLDALVVGLMDRSFLQRAASANARAVEKGLERIFDAFEDPWPSFHTTIREALEQVIVSHKPDHGVAGQLHNDTAYGFARKNDPRGNAVHRVAADQIDTKSLLKIQGKQLRASLLAQLAGMTQQDALDQLAEWDETVKRGSDVVAERCGDDEKEFQARIQAFFAERGIRRVRIVEEISLVGIRNRRGKRYKGFKTDSNAYLGIYEAEATGKWEEELVSTFAANQGAAASRLGRPNGEEGRRFIKRLFNRDLIEFKHAGKRRVFCIQRMSKGIISLAEHFEANADSRNRDKSDPFAFVYKNANSLRQSKPRFLVVTPAGRVRYLSDDPNDSDRG